jgi:hypothetical protein
MTPIARLCSSSASERRKRSIDRWVRGMFWPASTISRPSPIAISTPGGMT